MNRKKTHTQRDCQAASMHQNSQAHRNIITGDSECAFMSHNAGKKRLTQGRRVTDIEKEPGVGGGVRGSA